MKAVIANSLNNLSLTRVKRIAWEGGWIVAGQAATVLGTLGLVRVVTQYLSPAQYGQLALILTVSVLINQLVTGGLGHGISRFFPIATSENKLHSYFNASFKLFVYAIFFSVLLGVCVILFLVSTAHQEYVYQVMAVVIFSIISAGTSVLSGILNMARRRALVAIHTASEAWLKIILILCILNIFRPSVIAVIAAYCLSSLIVAFSQFLFLKYSLNTQGEGNIHEVKNWMNQIWKFALPFSIWGIFTWGQQASDRWALEHFSSTSDVGQYVVVFQLGYVPIGILTGLLVSYLSPVFYQRFGSGNNPNLTASVHRLSWIVAILSLIATVVAFVFTFFFHSWLFSFLVAPAFRSASRFLPWVILAGGLFAAGQMLSMKLMSELRTSNMTTSKIVTAIIGVGLNFYGAYKFGVAGVIASIVIFSAVYFIWMMMLARNSFLDISK